MEIFIYISVFILAVFFAVFTGYQLGKIILSIKRKQDQKRLRREAAGINEINFDINFCCEGFAQRILKYLLTISYSMSFISEQDWISKKLIRTKHLSKKLLDLKTKCNMPDVVTNYSLREVQIRFSFISFFVGLVLGYLFSYYLMVILSIALFCVAWYLPIWALKQEKNLRTQDLEKNLPEMLEVVALGLRSGLTFDRSLNIYCNHFDNELVKSFSLSQKKWEGGLISREDALRDLGASYESITFNRMIDNIIRSLRFGCSLVESLEDAALESRNIYKAQQEEIVSKAPVKMMIPTGTLIRPAMLILILGPILLELGSGF